MSAVDDLGAVLAQSFHATNTPNNINFHTGQIITWDSASGTNSIRVLGTTVYNIPVLTSANTTALIPGVTVGLLKVKTQYFVLGRVVSQNSGLVNPQFPIVLYPLFAPNTTAGTADYSTVLNGVLATWEGRIKVSFPYIQIDGIWGNASGSGSTTYEIKLSGVTVGSWTSTTLDVSKHGPYNITDFLGQDWVTVQVSITSSTGTGDKAFQVLGCYFRDSL